MDRVYGQRGSELRPPDVREYDACADLWPSRGDKLAGEKNRKEIGLGGVRCSHFLEPGIDDAIRRPNHSFRGPRKLFRDRQKQLFCDARACRVHTADFLVFQRGVCSVDRPDEQQWTHSEGFVFHVFRTTPTNVGAASGFSEMIGQLFSVMSDGFSLENR